MRQLKFTPLAEAQLDDILIWTFDEFGPQQADRYENELINRCTAIADGIAATQNCSNIMQPGSMTRLRYGRAGQHIVVFTDEPDHVTVVGILHSKSDLAAHLDVLTQTSE